MENKKLNLTHKYRPGPRIRHILAAAGAVALNAALVILLAAWNMAEGDSAGKPPRAVPLEVVDLPEEEMKIVTDAAVTSAAPAEKPAAPNLPSPPMPKIATETVKLDAPTMPRADAVLVPEVSDRLPDISAEAISTPVVGRSPNVPPTPDPSSPGPAGTTRGPLLIQPPDLSRYYPRRAKIDGVTGRTILRLVVGKQGRVTNVNIISSTPSGVFETAAKRAARTLTFRPALRDGQPIRVSTRLVMKWRLED